MFDVQRRAASDLQGWARAQRVHGIEEQLSLAIVRAVSRQLSLRCKIADGLPELVHSGT